jgi:alanine racemase
MLIGLTDYQVLAYQYDANPLILQLKIIKVTYLHRPFNYMYHLQEIGAIGNAQLQGKTNANIQYFLFDSRQFYTAEATLFVALQSGRNNGHSYIPELYKKGLRNFLIVPQQITIGDFPEANFLIADDPLLCLQKLAAHHRQQFQIPVIGITGSNGKTMVKEWLYQCLKSDYRICRSPRSYNSQVGVPISVLNLNEQHTLAIFEAGISKPGEMAQLQAIIAPSIGVFTHAGSAHDEGFASRQEKLQEKFKLFQASKLVIYNGLSTQDLDFFSGKECLNATKYKALTSDLPFKDEAAIENASTCAAVMVHLGYDEATIRLRLSQLQAVALRLEMRNGIQNSSIINDFYNSDLDSLRIALNYLRQNSPRPNSIVILSDIEQSGLSANQLYKEVQTLLSTNKVGMLVGIGSEISKHRSFFPANALFYSDTAAFVSAFRTISFQFSQSTILLKGARSAGFEQISRLLQLKSHDTVFEINLDRLRDNVNYYRGLLKPSTKIMGMVKATGYGSGAPEVARALQSMGAAYLAVAYADEGVELRESLIKLPIMVMSPEEEAFDDIINYQLEPEIYSFYTLERFLRKLDAYGVTEPFPIHLKIDTGMKRLGFEPNQVSELCAQLQQLSNIRVASIFSHLAAADNSSLDEFTDQQLQTFETAASQISKALGYQPLRHLCNSAGISRFPKAHFEMVRLGIGMYGLGVNTTEQTKLKNVGVLRSRISQLKSVAQSETVGYNRNGHLQRDSKIAVVPIGYADGFSRSLGNGKHGVYIQSQFCKTVGNICMDMCMVDVTDVACQEGDEVILFSEVDHIQQWATAIQSIPYEVLTSVSSRVKRLYTQE